MPIVYNNCIQLASPTVAERGDHLLSFLPIISPRTFQGMGLGIQNVVNVSSYGDFLESLASGISEGFFLYTAVDE